MGPLVYIETSIISYLVSRPSRDLVVAGHQALTAEWWEVVRPRVQPVVSPVVIDELAAGDQQAAQKRLSAVADMRVLDQTAEALRLAEQYFREIPMPQTAEADTAHLALAVAHGVDFLLTWNCKHLANGRVRSALEKLNLARGLQTPVICTPEELMEF